MKDHHSGASDVVTPAQQLQGRMVPPRFYFAGRGFFQGGQTLAGMGTLPILFCVLSVLLWSADLLAQETTGSQATPDAKPQTPPPTTEVTAAASQESDDDLDLLSKDPEELFNSGDYQLATKVALAWDAENERYDADENYSLIAIHSQMQLGKFKEALRLHEAAIEKFPQSIRQRWLAVEVYRYNDDEANAARMLVEIEALARRSPWRYRDIDNQLGLIDFLLTQDIDAKEILTRVLKPIQQQNPRLPGVYIAIGKLALGKADYALAAENYEEAAKLDRFDPEIFLGLARAYKPSDWSKASENLNQALSINPKHVDSILMLADHLIAAEDYPTASRLLDDVLKINQHHPVAWSYKAVLAHLESEHEEELVARQNALRYWKGNPEVDHVIGRELSEKYRFEEGSQYQRRSLVYDPNYTPAKMQLAHDLLRLGQEMEGWALAESVFDADQYSVVAHNLLTLRDNISGFTTLEQNGFVVRMDRLEADLYGVQVLRLLADAERELVQKYDVELQKPVFIEIFPRQQDFAIRTFGLPGGSGYLGVCFGRLITMNSPAAQGSSLTSWRSVLWHEFCHVVTLQKTENKMPRWLSEGISVYEERLKDPAWGQGINPTFQQFMLGEELTPVSKLSGAFLTPKSAIHVQFAYYESSLVVEYLIEKFGKQSLLDVMDELRRGIEINQALSRHAAPIDFIDRDFEKYARQLATSFAPDASFKLPEEETPTDLAQWQQFNQDNPGNIPGMMFEAQLRIQQEQYDAAIPILQQVISLAPEVSNDARQLLAACYQSTGDEEKEYAVLEELNQKDSDSVEVLSRLIDLATAREDWAVLRQYSDRLLALNPLIRLPHQSLALVAEKTNDAQLAAESLLALTQLSPADPADVHYRLAAALEELASWEQSKRHVLLAIENAPRYRDAHQLLLRLVERENENAASRRNSLERKTAIEYDAPPVPKATRPESNTTSGEDQ